MDEEGKGNMNPESLITEDHIKKVLLVEKGSDAQLVSWKLVNFTKTGDNYATSVMGVEVKYSIKSKIDKTFYVAKLNPQRRADGYEQMNQDMFMHESEFYLCTLPELDGVMKSIGLPQLNFPRCFHRSLIISKEQIYFEDLRKKGFILFDRKKGMDVAHTTLVLRELARLHAASLLLEAKSQVPLEVKYEHLKKDLLSGDFCKAKMYPMVENSMTRSIQMLETIGSYEKAIDWIESLKPQIEDIFTTQMKTEGYNVICHGDCWNNNILFRYDNDGIPVEVMLIDLQTCRKASLATDLNYFMYTSINSDVRRPNLNTFLNTYYKYFKGVADAGGMTMPFTEKELFKEFRSKNIFGAVFGMLILPIVLIEAEEVPDMEECDGDLMKMIDGASKNGMAMIQGNPMVKPRFLGIFDELIETGLIA